MTDIELLRKRWPFDKAELLDKWKTARSNLAQWAVYEAELRTLIVFEAGFPAEDGTHYFELAEGFRLQCVRRTNYTISKEKGALEGALLNITNMGEEGKFIAQRVIKYTPELVMKEYKDLQPHYKSILDRVVTSKPGMPALELIPPKEPK